MSPMRILQLIYFINIFKVIKHCCDVTLRQAPIRGQSHIMISRCIVLFLRGCSNICNGL